MTWALSSLIEEDEIQQELVYKLLQGRQLVSVGLLGTQVLRTPQFQNSTLLLARLLPLATRQIFRPISMFIPIWEANYAGYYTLCDNPAAQ